jgi:hypothetical protein
MQVWSGLILWFLKPLFDRPALQVIAVRFFEPRSGAGRIFRGLGNTFRGLPGDLLWRRFSPWRAVMLPVRALEGLKPAQVRRRKRVLSNGGMDFCVFLTVWGVVLECMLLAGEGLFLLMAVELLQENYIDSIVDFFAGQELFFFAAYCVNSMLVESLYVCMGFGLYINSRVEVEGWDLQILFQSFLRNPLSAGTAPQNAAHTGAAQAALKKTAAGALALCLFLGLPAPVKAYGETPAPDSAAVPLGVLEEILGSEDFGGEKPGWGIRLRNQQENDEPLPQLDVAPWVEVIKKIFAAALRIVLALAILALGIFSALYMYRLRNRGGVRRRRIHAEALPANAPGESPAQLLERARRLHNSGQLREAWAACFAAALAAWSRYRGVSFPPEATEYGCLALVRKSGPAGARGFADMVLHWVALAYGGRLPPEGAFDRALVLCESLGADFG